MKKYIIYQILLGMLIWTACDDAIDSPVLPFAEDIVMAQPVELEAEQLFGVWGGTTSFGSTNVNYFEQSYRIEFQSIEDGEAVLSHWYTDAETEMEQSKENIEYVYTYADGVIEMVPKATYALDGVSNIKAVHVGDNKMVLYTMNHSKTDSICTLNRIGDPIPSITGVDRTLPQPGEVVTVTGRNLQFVNHVYLPTVDGEVEVSDITFGSKQIKFVVPQAKYAPGSIRCLSTTAHQSCYSPAYMFRTDCVFFHNFNDFKKTAPYVGTEFEYTISTMGTLRNSVSYLSSEKLPKGHSLTMSTESVYHPDSLLSFFGDEPIEWNIDTKTDPSKGYLRFSSADRFQYVLDHCNGDLTGYTPCADVAIQMDIYVYSDGRPEWNTGYLSWRLNKDNSSLSTIMSANVAMWDKDNPVSFAEGWRTFTIPLSKFKVTANSATSTLGTLIASLKSSNLQTIIKLVNYPLDELHPVQKLNQFQFSMANIRLVPYWMPTNTEEE